MNINEENAIKFFINSAILQAKANENGDAKAGNKNYNKIVLVAKYLKKNNFLGKLKKLLNDDNIGVKLWAATYLLEVEENEAKTALYDLVEKRIPHYSFTAEMILEEWNNGDMKLQY